MINSRITKLICTGLAALMLAACENLPGTRKEQGAVIGGAAGAATGAVVGGSKHRALGAVLGGLLGAGGGYVIAAQTDKVKNQDQAGATNAMKNAQQNPATPEQARTAPTADLNGDGFVTLDEVVAMKNAGLPDSQMIDKMRATGQVFELTQDQKSYLMKNGVSQYVVNQMANLNQTGTGTVPSSAGTPPDTSATTPTVPTTPPAPTPPTPPATPPQVISQPPAK